MTPLVIALIVLAIVVLVPIAVFSYFWVDGRRAWSPADKLAERLPGDDLLLPDDRFMRLQEEIVINAPPEQVWPVLAQLGQNKGGFYALSWLERLCTFRIHNTYDVVDAWQDVKAGDFLFYHQAGIGSQLAEVVPGRYFTSISDTRRPPTAQRAMALRPPFGIRYFAWTWNFVLQELPGGRTRFVNRCDTTWEPFDRFLPKALVVVILGSPSVFMVHKMLVKVKRVSEGRQRLSLIDRAVRRMGVWSDEARPVPLGTPRPVRSRARDANREIQHEGAPR
jgi:hypothetical protein